MLGKPSQARQASQSSKDNSSMACQDLVPRYFAYINNPIFLSHNTNHHPSPPLSPPQTSASPNRRVPPPPSHPSVLITPPSALVEARTRSSFVPFKFKELLGNRCEQDSTSYHFVSCKFLNLVVLFLFHI